jgi:general secretion pathway protein E
MIGEIRDLETAEIAIQSALTGHLVFSTLHTNDAPSAVTRLLDMGVESFLLSSTIRGVLAQRLVRIICPYCKVIDPTPSAQEELVHLKMGNIRTLYLGTGCEHCAHTGFFGRIGIFELFIVDDTIRRMILNNEDAQKMREVAKQNGMRTLLDDGLEKVRDAQTTLNEVLRVTQEV